MISYEIPLGVALLCVVLAAGDVRPTEIIAQQSDSAWNLIHLPLVALIFYICMLAEANRAPFDLAEAESELVGGWHTEYSSMKWALFFLGEYVNLFIGGALFAILFLGGWSLNPVPGLIPFDVPDSGGLLVILLQVVVVMAKAFLLVCLAMLVRWTIPRFRFDQLMKLAWEVLIPVSLVMLLMVSFMMFMGWGAYLWVASLVMTGVIVVVMPWLPRQADPNHKIELVGSRFSPVRDDDVRTSPSHPAALADSPLSQG